MMVAAAGCSFDIAILCYWWLNKRYASKDTLHDANKETRKLAHGYGSLHRVSTARTRRRQRSTNKAGYRPALLPALRVLKAAG